MDGTFISIDLETTGADPKTDKIIEVGLVKLEQGVITQSYHALVNPGIKLPVKIKRLTQISDDDLQDKPTIEEILPEIIAFIADYPLLGHNVSFDRAFIEATAKQTISNPLYDTLDLARIVLPKAPNHRLGTLCKLLKIEQPQQHRALDDARGTALLAVELIKRLDKLELPLLRNLATLLEISQSPWYTTLHKMLVQRAKQFSDRKITSISGLRPVQEDLHNFLSPEQSEDEVSPLDEQDIVSFLGPNGKLSEAIDRYEHRPQQLAMAKAVAESLNKGLYMLAEAGTGTGKSMAYLIPAILWAQKNHRRVVISTHTINLQEQLWEKDIPLLQSLPEFNFKAALVKGRSNYICLRRWYAEIKTMANIKPREAEFYARILLWLTETETGDRSELNLSWADNDLWGNICAESEGCLGKRCGFYYRLCFVNRMRRRAERADIIIVNHSLVLSDIKTENRVLPPYKALVFDEAHHLEQTATEQLGTVVTKSSLLRWLTNVTKVINKFSDQATAFSDAYWHEKIIAAKGQPSHVREAEQIFFTQLANFLLEKNLTDEAKVTLRLKEDCNIKHLAVETENLIQRIKTLATGLADIANAIEGFTLDGEDERARELTMLADQGLALATDIEFVCQGDSKDYVYWLEGQFADHGYVNISLHAVPIEVGPLLHGLLYSQKDSIIFTSATLTVDGSFDHFSRRSGVQLIKPELLKHLRVDSPFQYDTQSLLYILNDLPEQRSVSELHYYQRVANVIGDLAKVCQGRTLVLFTAHRMLRQVYQLLKPTMEEQDILLLGHDIDGSRSRLVEEFKSAERAVLFGAASFWEGLDVPGNSLSCVVLVKLPFWPPNVPVVEARTEALQQKKLNGFIHFSLPEAVIRFKQGFGRLIRTKYDQGVVVVLDRRIIDKHYGQKFLNSLPISTYQKGNSSCLMTSVKGLLSKENTH